MKILETPGNDDKDNLPMVPQCIIVAAIFQFSSSSEDISSA